MREKPTAFRPTPDNKKRLEMAQTLGLNISEIINDLLRENFDTVLRQKSKKIEAALKMVRGGGFEPPTPTVSR